MRHAILAILLAAPTVTGDPAPVGARMQNVNVHLGSGIELRIATLYGRLARSNPGTPPTFDDVGSYVIEIDSARFAMTPDSLTNLMNNYVFADAKAPITHLKVEVEGSELKQSGTLRKGIDVPFSIRAQISATRDGRIRLHPTSMKAAGFVSKRVLDFFGLELEKLIKVNANSPVKVDGDDLLLDPEHLLPPPRIRGKLTRTWIADGLIMEQFGPDKPAHAIAPPPGHFPNYMFYRGGTLRFGKLTMSDTDLLLVDEDPKDAFDFSPEHYNDQLTAGYSKNTRDHGLITHMPDFDDLTRAQR